MTYVIDRELDSATLQRLLEQGRSLLRTYRLEYEADPDSRATQVSRSHLIALLHTVRQLHGENLASSLNDTIRANTGFIAPELIPPVEYSPS